MIAKTMDGVICISQRRTGCYKQRNVILSDHGHSCSVGPHGEDQITQNIENVKISSKTKRNCTMRD